MRFWLERGYPASNRRLQFDSTAQLMLLRQSVRMTALDSAVRRTEIRFPILVDDDGEMYLSSGQYQYRDPDEISELVLTRIIDSSDGD